MRTCNCFFIFAIIIGKLIWQLIFKLKSPGYGSVAQGFAVLGDSYKIWGLLIISSCMGLNTAFAAVQCNSWEALANFTIVASFNLSFWCRIWCHSGKGDGNKFGYYFRKFLLSGKCPPPTGVPKPVYRGFEIVMEGLGLSVGFATMIFVYFLSDPRIVPYSMVRQLCVPYGSKSLLFLLAMAASDLIQDIAGVVWVAKRVGFDFARLLGHPFAKRNRPFFLCQASSWWAMCWLVQFGWLFQQLQVGPFDPNVWGQG